MKKLTRFQIKVFKTVCKIPLGETRSYQWVARKINRPKAYRAVARALSNNPYLITIPCHRVIRSDGSLGGYVLGQEEKRKLLNQELELINSIGGKNGW
ncbi:MAG: MGMT family protein [Candidatus Omnitrophota bacterium]